ncbi:glycoside hydrolase family 16 protein [Skermanella mucosa]|uniref:glycoside hydrolase family 16 protein n=1 Tax=Skermanella mucosa TaxID=1789672 RepID=UPI00192BFF0B|nr:glycoside hydrolase family 16 protein [Skermanella mucosa]UEM18689.1 glycoside hydrolase family 16 protein [Skermanella mucosa]
MIGRLRLTAAVLTGAALLACAPGRSATPSADANNGYMLTFAEDFTDPAATFPNARWTTDYARWGGMRTLPDNGERQIYVDRTLTDDAGRPLGIDPFSIADGTLAIAANPTPALSRPFLNDLPYTSGLLTSTHCQLYGYFEMRARMPKGQGLWPAFWLVGVGDHGNLEIDVVEVHGQRPQAVHQTVHDTQGKATHVYQGPDSSTGFHVYGLEWTPDRIVWSVDGVETFRRPNTIHVAMYMLLNLAVGGNWPGYPDRTTLFPAQFLVDYVRAFHRRPHSADRETRLMPTCPE